MFDLCQNPISGISVWSRLSFSMLRSGQVDLGPDQNVLPSKWWFWRLLCNDRDGCRLRLKSGRVIDMKGSQTYLLPPHLSFDRITEVPMKHSFVHFGISGLPDGFWLRLWPEGVSVSRKSRTEDSFFQRSGPLGALGYTIEVFSEAMEGLSEERKAMLQLALSPSPQIDATVQKAKSLKGCTTVRECAEACSLSPDGFSRLFKRHYGHQPSVWLMELRLHHAVELLLHGDLDMEALALECGFSDRHAFTRAFSRWSGMGPAKFRKVYLRPNL